MDGDSGENVIIKKYSTTTNVFIEAVRHANAKRQLHEYAMATVIPALLAYIYRLGKPNWLT